MFTTLAKLPIDRSMISVVYISCASQPFSSADLVELLDKSRVKNTALGISGLLLYRDLSFIQVLEGPEEAVRRLLRTISSDFRHKGIIRLLEKTIEERQFENWSMGFRNLNDPDVRSLLGFNEFLNQSLSADALHKDTRPVLRLLDTFRRSFVS